MWRPEDFTFRSGMQQRDEWVRYAEGGQWATVRRLRTASGDPHVVYVDQPRGAALRMRDAFGSGLTVDGYAVHRISG